MAKQNIQLDKKYIILLLIAAMIWSVLTQTDAEDLGTSLGDSQVIGQLLSEEDQQQWLEETIQTLGLDQHTMIEVDGGDRSGERENRVCVDVGFGDRTYLAFTNDYGQLVTVIAAEIILQDDDLEPVTSKGRYYHDEAAVAGTELSTYDQGHVIADSLGGVSNAYNITPQESHMNRYGNQAYIEEAIRAAGGCEYFIAQIHYPDHETQIPSEYEISWTINGEALYDSFFNMNPDDASQPIQ